MKQFLTAAVAASVLGVFMLTAADAQYDGSFITTGTENGIAYASGGVGVTERTIMKGWFDKYNLRVSCALETGQYVSRIPITIADDSGKTVLKKTTSGPWFLVRLPKGRYTVSATYEDRQDKKTFAVESGFTDVRFRWE